MVESGSTTIPWMFTGLALIPVLVVAREPSHELLCFVGGFITDFLPEVVGVAAAQRGCKATVMKDLDLTALTNAEGEAEIMAGGALIQGVFCLSLRRE
jgi:hypothetical protein